MWNANQSYITDGMSDMRYEWDTKRACLDFEIGKAESQLRSLENRLKLLQLDVIISALFVAIPYCLLLLTRILSVLSAHFILAIILGCAYDFILVVYIILLPFTLYQLIKCSLLLYYNKREKVTWQKPALRSDFLHRNTSREESYSTERHKLNWILTKYYTYRHEMDQMKRDMENKASELDYTEDMEKLEHMVYYEEIRPASPFVGTLVTRTRIITGLMLVVIILILFLTL